MSGHAAFEFTPSGELAVRLGRGITEAIANLGDQLRGIVEHGGGAESDVHSRLFPRAYLDPTEDRAELEWQVDAHSELVQRRLEQIEVLERSLARDPDGDPVRITLSPEEVEAWLGVINDIRLALGVALDVSAETDFDAVPLDDPTRGLVDVYEVLGVVQGRMLEELLGYDAEAD